MDRRVIWVAFALLVVPSVVAVTPQQVIHGPGSQLFGADIEARDGHAIIDASPYQSSGARWLYGEDGTWKLLRSNSYSTTNTCVYWGLGTLRFYEGDRCVDGPRSNDLITDGVNIIDPVNKGRVHRWTLDPFSSQTDVVRESDDDAPRMLFAQTMVVGEGWWATTWENSTLVRVAGQAQSDEVTYTNAGIFVGDATTPTWMATAGPFNDGQTPQPFRILGKADQAVIEVPSSGLTPGGDVLGFMIRGNTLTPQAPDVFPPGNGQHGILADLTGSRVRVHEQTPTGWAATDTFQVTAPDVGGFLTEAYADGDAVVVGVRADEHLEQCDPCVQVIDREGRALVYHRMQTGEWVLHETIKGPRDFWSGFGTQVALDGWDVLIGAPGYRDNNGDVARSGKVYVRTMNHWPTAGFTWDPVYPTALSLIPITFTSHAVDDESTRLDQAWDLNGNGTFDAEGETTKWTYMRPGLHTVTLHVEDPNGGRDAIAHDVLIKNRRPFVDFAPTPEPIWRQAQTLMEHTSWDLDGTIATCDWDFGNGDTSTSCNPTYTYTAIGTYTITLTACDDGDLQGNQVLCDTKKRTYDVTNHPPVITFQVQGDPITNEAFTLHASAVDPDGSIATQGWVDGTTAQARQVTPERPGTIRFGYTATDNEGLAATEYIDIDVTNRPPTVDFDLPTDVATRIPLQFVDKSGDPDGRIGAWSWTFGDGNASADPSPVHHYERLGTYNVSLTVLDDFGAPSGTVTKQLVVDNLAPVAQFTVHVYDADTGDPRAEVLDASFDLDGRIVASQWSLDGAPHEPSWPWTFPLPDPAIRIGLTVEDDKGTQQTVYRLVGKVPDPPVTAPEATPEEVPEDAPESEPETQADPGPATEPEPRLSGPQRGWLIGSISFVLLAAAGVAVFFVLRR